MFFFLAAKDLSCNNIETINSKKILFIFAANHETSECTSDNSLEINEKKRTTEKSPNVRRSNYQNEREGESAVNFAPLIKHDDDESDDDNDDNLRTSFL